MPLTSSITRYNSQWPGQYTEEAQRVVPVFGDALVEHHHVGSTAVLNLAAKPEIDILVVVTGMGEVNCWTAALSRFGYRRGGDLGKGHLFYKRDIDGVRTHKIHVCLSEHSQIKAMLAFRDHLRCHRQTLDQYQALKLKLERMNTQGIAEYVNGKQEFILKVLMESPSVDSGT